MALSASAALAEPMALLDRNGSRVAVEPYAPNIVRVTIALDPALASAAPGEAQCQARRRRMDASCRCLGRCLRLRRADADGRCQALSARAHDDGALFRALAAAGQPLDQGRGRQPSGAHERLGNGPSPSMARTFKVGASFDATPGEHFWGLGQNQEGGFDLRGPPDRLRAQLRCA
jgi:alpha-D-xyloside xylohydrolase